MIKERPRNFLSRAVYATLVLGTPLGLLVDPSQDTVGLALDLERLPQKGQNAPHIHQRELKSIPLDIVYTSLCQNIEPKRYAMYLHGSLERCE